MEPFDTFRVRRHGEGPTRIICLHGGPGVGVGLTAASEPLAATFGTLDYVQRRSGGELLTVGRHVEDLRAIVEAYCPAGRPVIIGASWAAMLALAFGAAHPGMAAGLVLVGCGTFDKRSRAMIEPVRQARIRPEDRVEIARLEREILEPAERIGAIHALTSYVDNYCPLPQDEGSREGPGFDAPGFNQTWGDMMRLQEEGVYPAAFRAVTCPVLMVHGSYDPHPGRRIRDSLLPHIPHLEYLELDRCGHDPWCERYARDRFFQAVSRWAAEVLGSG